VCDDGPEAVAQWPVGLRISGARHIAVFLPGVDKSPG